MEVHWMKNLSIEALLIHIEILNNTIEVRKRELEFFNEELKKAEKQLAIETRVIK